MVRRAFLTATAGIATTVLAACAALRHAEPLGVAPGSSATGGDEVPVTRSAGELVDQAAAPRFTIDPRLTLYRPLAGPRLSVVAAESAGVVEHPIHQSLGRPSNTAGTRLAAELRLLPEESTDPRRFAVLAVPHVILRSGEADRPGRRDNLSELTQGEELWLLDRSAAPVLRADRSRAGRTPAGTGPGPSEPAAVEDSSPDDRGSATRVRPSPATTSPATTSPATTSPAATPPAATPAATSPGATVAGGPAWLVHASDGYLGWVDESALRFVDAADFAARLRSHTSDAAQTQIAKAIAHARSLAGTPYLWGGKTAAGIDCSGLVQASYAAAGVRLPRDADMQSSVGRMVATRWFRDGLIPGDLLFFLHARRGHVHHVAMYLGGGKFIESAGKGVAVRSINPGDADYDAKRDAEFGWARRVLE
jgi:cell wall-associated NlpC family hydrolase